MEEHGPGEDWDEEDAGARLMALVLGGRPRQYDFNGGTPKHDFDICMPDGSVIALEITEDKVQERENQRGAIEKLRWRFDDLSREWFVDLIDRVRVQSLNSQLPCLLGHLERDGITELIVPRVADDNDENTNACILQKLRCLGVHACRSYEPEGDSVGLVHIDQSVDPAWGDVDSAVAVVVRHVSERTDNAHKLRLARSATEHHLLIWVDHAALDARAAMEVGERHQQLPSEVPELPGEIDVAWLALSVVNPIVWRLDHTRWQTLGRIKESGPLE